MDDRFEEPERAASAAGDPRRWWAAGAAAALAAVVTLRWFGRPWWCAIGDWAPGVVSAESQHTSQHLLDPYTATHVLHGVVFYGVLWLALRARAGVSARGVVAVALEAAWEVLENTDWVIERYRTTALAHDYFGDSVLNSVADIAACLAGFALAHRLPGRVAAGLFVAVEVVLYATIRDGLTLNVLGLLGLSG